MVERQYKQLKEKRVNMEYVDEKDSTRKDDTLKNRPKIARKKCINKLMCR